MTSQGQPSCLRGPSPSTGCGTLAHMGCSELPAGQPRGWKTGWVQSSTTALPGPFLHLRGLSTIQKRCRYISFSSNSSAVPSLEPADVATGFVPCQGQNRTHPWLSHQRASYSDNGAYFSAYVCIIAKPALFISREVT